jgi:Ran GTPase-activating protein (RanGAP) involved in mRNA processing and transport
LDLSCNNISDDGFLYLCQYLKDLKANAKLRSLCLNYNKFRIPTAAKELAEAMLKCPKLRRAEFKMCRIDDEVCRELSLMFSS